MLEQIRTLEQAGAWDELSRLACALPPGQELARVFIALSKLQEDRATTAAEYRQALAYAEMGVTSDVAPGLMWTWAHGRAAALAADLGLYRAAESHALAFLGALGGHPQASALVPWVWAALARVRAHQGRFAEAILLWRRTLASTEGELAERAILHLVWTQAEAGCVRQALASLPTAVSFVSEGHLNAARAVLLAAIHDWTGARREALAALRDQARGGWAVFDTIQTAELCMILRKAALADGAYRQAAVWYLRTAEVLSRWNVALVTCLIPTLRVGGGETFAAVSSARGLPAGYKQCGTRGAVG